MIDKYSYEFREVICCKCNHKFMWEKSSEWQYEICKDGKKLLVKAAICPKCGSTDVTQYTRIIGYLRPVTSFGSDRQIEASKRIYSKEV